MSDPLKEMQRTLLVGLRDDLVSKGWTLDRDNEAGGALVLSGDGMVVVAGLHVYEQKVAVEPEVEPPAQTEEILEVVGVSEDEAVVEPAPEEMPA